jgi:predicted ribonuclease YlaK
MTKDVILGPQEGAQELAIESDADLVIFGGAAGAGKSHLLLLKAALGVDDPLYNAIIFRRTTTALRDGLWREAKELYRPWKPREQDNPMRFIFKSNGIIKMNHMEHEKNAVDDH